MPVSLLHRYSLLLILFLPMAAWATPKLDSLQHVHESPEALMAAYYNWAMEGFRNETAEALIAGHRALHLADSLGIDSTAAKSHLVVGICHSIFAEYDSGLYHFHKSLSLSKKLGDRKLRARALQNLGIISYRTGELEEALQYYGRVEAMCRENKDSMGLSRIYTNLGNVSWQKGNLWDALKYYQQSLNIKEALGDSVRIPNAMTNIAVVYMDQENFPQALSLFQQALVVYQRHQNNIGLATTFSNIGVAYERMGDYEGAYNQYLYALDIQEQLGLTLAINQSQTNLARLNAQLGKHELAYVQFEFSECEQLKLEDYIGLAGTYHGWAEALLKQKAFAEGLEMSYKSLWAANESDVVQAQITSFSLLATLHKEVGNWDSVYHYAQAMEKLVSLYQQDRFVKEILQLKSEYAAHEGRSEEALAYLNELRKVEKKEAELRLKGSELRQEIQYWTERGEAAKAARQQAWMAETQLQLYRTQNAQGWMLTLMFSFVIATIILAYSYIQSRRTQRLLSAQQADLSQKNHALAELHKEHTHLLGVITHGMRTPVSQIKAITQIVEEDQNRLSKEESDRFLSAIKDANKRLSHHIDQILKLNTLEVHTATWEMKTVNLQEIITPLLDQAIPVLLQKDLTLETEFCETPCQGFADPDHLSTTIDNLLSNAIKFSPSGKTITVGTQYRPDREEVRIFVRDEGPGIKHSELPQIFDKYTRLSNKPTKGEPSTGLGLAIVKANMEEMQGRVWVDSEVGNGTTFWLALPASRSLPQPETAQSQDLTAIS